MAKVNTKKAETNEPTTVELATQLAEISNWIALAEEQLPLLEERERRIGFGGDSREYFGLGAFDYDSMPAKVRTKLYKNFVRTMKTEIKNQKALQADLVSRLSK